MKEADITVSGTLLTQAQSLAIRVALGQFQRSLLDNGLGTDKHGELMTKHYLERIGEINALIRLSSF